MGPRNKSEDDKPWGHRQFPDEPEKPPRLSTTDLFRRSMPTTSTGSKDRLSRLATRGCGGCPSSTISTCGKRDLCHIHKKKSRRGGQMVDGMGRSDSIFHRKGRLRVKR